MSRKIYTVLSLLLIAAFALAACGTPATEALRNLLQQKPQRTAATTTCCD